MSAPGFESAPIPDDVNAQRLIVEVGTGRWRSLPYAGPTTGNRTFGENETYLGFDIGARFDSDRHLPPDPEERDETMRKNWTELMRQRPQENIGFVQANGTELPLVDSVVDEVIFSNVFGHGTKSSHADLLKEANRIVKPDGVVVIHDYTSPEYRNWTQIERLITRAGLEPNPIHIRLAEQEATPNHYADIANEYGLKVVNLQGLDGVVWRLGKLSAAAQAPLSPWEQAARKLLGE